MLPIPLSTRLRGFAFRGTVQVAALAAASHAATFNVKAFSDPNGCGLREAIDVINSGIAKAGCPAPDNSSNDIYMLGGTYSATIGLKLSRYANIICAGPGECNLDAGNFSGPLLTLAGASDPHVYIQKVGFRQLSDNANTVTGISVEAGYVGLEDVSISGFKGTGLAILDGTDNNVLRGRFSNMGSNAVAVGTGAGLRMEYCYISGSSVGVFLSQDATTHIDMSLIEGNTGRGIKSTGEFFLRRSTVRGNKSGGIRVDGGFGNIDYCSIESNSTPGDGGGIAILAGYANVHYSTISENSATGNGGGVYMKTGANLHHTTISTNTADLGGGIYHDPQGAAGSGYAEPAHCTIAFNKAHTRGGGIYRLIGNGSAHTLNGSIVANNSAPTHPDVSGDGKGLLNSSYTLRGHRRIYGNPLQ